MVCFVCMFLVCFVFVTWFYEAPAQYRSYGAEDAFESVKGDGEEVLCDAQSRGCEV